MGLIFTRLWNSLQQILKRAPEPWTVMVLGLFGSGRTTVVYQLKYKEFVDVPSLENSFNVETVEIRKGLKFTLWDMVENKAMRRHYYDRTDGLVFVVDSSDPQQFPEAAEELREILETPQFPDGVPILILANKQDLPDAATTQTVAEKLQLNSFSSNKWHVEGCSALTGGGLHEGLEQLHLMLTADTESDTKTTAPHSF